RAHFAAKEDVAVGQQGGVTQLLQYTVCVLGRNGVNPGYLSVSHKEDRLIAFSMIPLAGVKKRMLGETATRQRWHDGRLFAARSRCAPSQQSRTAKDDCRQKRAAEIS